MDRDLRGMYEQMKRHIEDNLPLTLTPDQMKGLLYDHGVYMDCDDCGVLARTPGQLNKELGRNWWWGDDRIIEEHKVGCKWAAKWKKP